MLLTGLLAPPSITGAIVVFSVSEKNRDIVLVVDDEPNIIRAITVGLATAGFRVVVAENGAAGLDTFLSMKDEICLVIADVIMPAMGGQEMAAAIREIKPDVKILLTSGYSDPVIKLADKYDFPFVRKPFLIQDLVRKVAEVLGRSANASG